MRTVLRKIHLLGRPKPNDLHLIIRETVPTPMEMGEAEMDRYRTYHRSNQHGR